MGIGGLRCQGITIAEVEIEGSGEARYLAIKPADIAIVDPGCRVSVIREISLVPGYCGSGKGCSTARPAIGASGGRRRDCRAGNSGDRVIADDIDRCLEVTKTLV